MTAPAFPLHPRHAPLKRAEDAAVSHVTRTAASIDTVIEQAELRQRTVLFAGLRLLEDMVDRDLLPGAEAAQARYLMDTWADAARDMEAAHNAKLAAWTMEGR